MRGRRILILTIALFGAGLAGFLAFLLTTGEQAPPETVIVQAPLQTQEEPAAFITEVLTVNRDIGIGETLQEGDLLWRPWPEHLLRDEYVTSSVEPNAIREWAGDVANAPLYSGEPVTSDKVVDVGSGFLAVLITPGMRAASMIISEESAVGGFILPNDRVDVILTRAQSEGQQIANERVGEILLSDVRVLAIDQNFQSDGTTASLVGRTATLELSPEDAVVLETMKREGDLSLALHSYLPLEGAVVATAHPVRRTLLRLVRGGVASSTPVRRFEP